MTKATVSLVFAAAIAVVLNHPASASRQAPAATDLLDWYAAGAYPRFMAAAAPYVGLPKAFETYESEADGWIGTDAGAARARRRLVAASVALELANQLQGEPDDRAAPYLIWASEAVRPLSSTAPSLIERRWYLACLAGMQQLDEPWVLAAGRSAGSSTLERQRTALGSGGQIAIAAARFPDEPRFMLARIQAAEAPVIEHDFSPWLIRYAREWEHEDPHILARYRQIPELLSVYRQLEADPRLRAEAALHIGYLETARMNWEAGLERLADVPAMSNEPFLVYLSHFMAGRVHQLAGDGSRAVDSFEAALSVVPNSRSAATLLAAQLMLSDRPGDRRRSYAVLQRAYAPEVPVDPWMLFRKGDAWRWTEYMQGLRDALRRDTRP